MSKQLKLRLPDQLHAEIKRSAKTHERSLNGEILFRLEVERRQRDLIEAMYRCGVLKR